LPDDVPGEPPRRGSGGASQERARRGRALAWAKAAFDKFNNDWTMNWSSLVAFNVLISAFPMLVVLFTLLAWVPEQSGNATNFASQINRILPTEVAKSLDVVGLLSRVRASFGALILISVGGLVWGGANLFGAIENSFAVIFRVRTRAFLPRRIMSLVMMLLFALLLPLSFVSSLALGAGTTALGRVLPQTLTGPLPILLGMLTSLVSLFVLFLAIYVVVPNVPISLKYAWRGALIAAIVMAVLNTLFPFYTAHFLGTRQYGAAVIGTVLVTVTWFWLFSLILLVGAQANSLSMNLRPLPHDVSRMLSEGIDPEAATNRTARD
jgi:membrane protein